MADSFATHTANTRTGGSEEGGYKTLLEQILWENLKEKRRTRRWGIFFKLLFVVYLLVFLFALVDGNLIPEGSGEHTALVDVEGVIQAQGDVDADRVITGLRAAFKSEGSKGVIVRINSPGGSPVQAGYINDEIARLRREYPDKPLYAVISDICASGGYYIAAGADEIYANKASLVGSIGVLMDGFGFVGTMEKLGVERRLLTAGENKALLDPFSPQRSEDTRHVKKLLDQIHGQFIDVVKKGRGDRLADDPGLFSGLFWSGEQAKVLGLIDGFGGSGYVARDVIGAEDIVNYTPRESVIDRFAQQLGLAIARTLELKAAFSLPRLK